MLIPVVYFHNPALQFCRVEINLIPNGKLSKLIFHSSYISHKALLTYLKAKAKTERYFFEEQQTSGVDGMV